MDGTVILSLETSEFCEFYDQSRLDNPFDATYGYWNFGRDSILLGYINI